MKLLLGFVLLFSSLSAMAETSDWVFRVTHFVRSDATGATVRETHEFITCDKSVDPVVFTGFTTLVDDACAFETRKEWGKHLQAAWVFTRTGDGGAFTPRVRYRAFGSGQAHWFRSMLFGVDPLFVESHP